MTDLEYEVRSTIRKIENYRKHYAPTDYCDDILSCADGALIHQQEMLRKQHEAIKQLREALEDLERVSGLASMWDDESRKAARAALAATEKWK